MELEQILRFSNQVFMETRYTALVKLSSKTVLMALELAGRYVTYVNNYQIKRSTIIVLLSSRHITCLFKDYFNKKIKLMAESLKIILYSNTFSHTDVLWGWSMNATKAPLTLLNKSIWGPLRSESQTSYLAKL